MKAFGTQQDNHVPTTVGQCIEFARSQLDHIDAEFIAQHVLSMNGADLVVQSDASVTSQQVDQLLNCVAQRKKGVPVAYLTGIQGFWSFLVRVSSDVLIPRPETELLVETVLPYISEHSQVLDLGTGSGAIAIAIALETKAKTVATDISRVALDLCRKNASALNVSLELIESHWYDGVIGCFNVIVSNPPYLAETDPHQNFGDLRFEPTRALVAGATGLESLEVVIRDAPRFLEPNGLLAVEHGYDQSSKVQNLFLNAGFSKVATMLDLSDLPRVTYGFQTVNDHQLFRYSRQIMLPDIDVEGQDKLLDSTVAVIGLGGLGSPVALYLAASGVGKLALVDDDIVDKSNLQRQVIHDETSVGIAKVESAAQSIRLLNRETETQAIHHRLVGTELRDLFDTVDIVVDATDNFGSRYEINKACLSTDTPLVSGAAIRTEGQVAVFDFTDSDSPCYRCLYNDGADEELNCAENGVIAPLVGIIGTIQAMETLKLIVGFGDSLVGYVLYIDAKRMDFRKFKLPKNMHCPTCGDS